MIQDWLLCLCGLVKAPNSFQSKQTSAFTLNRKTKLCLLVDEVAHSTLFSLLLVCLLPSRIVVVVVLPDCTQVACEESTYSA